MSFSGDGDTVAIPAKDEPIDTNNEGAIYVWTRDGAGVWSQEQKVTMPGNDTANFGAYTQLSNDGDTLLAYNGSIGVRNPRIELFTRTAGVWTRGAMITENVLGAFQGGMKLSGDGNHLVHAHSSGTLMTYFDRSGDVFTQRSTIPLTDFVVTLYAAINDAGDRMVLGSTSGGGDVGGQAKVYRREGTEWFLDFAITPDISEFNAAAPGFGQSVAISGNGLIAAVGCGAEEEGGGTDSGAVMVYSI